MLGCGDGDSIPNESDQPKSSGAGGDVSEGSGGVSGSGGAVGSTGGSSVAASGGLGGETGAGGTQADAFRIVSTNITDERLFVNENIEIEFSHDVDAASLDAQSMSLTIGSGWSTPVELSYDSGSRTVTIDPSRLLYGLTYTLLLTAVESQKGEKVSAEFSFTTPDPLVTRRVYSDSATERTYGDSRFDYTERYIVKGIDGEYFTPDDVVQYFYASSLLMGAPAGETWVSRVEFNAPGLDSTWGTEDDVQSGRIDSGYNQYARRIWKRVFGDGVDNLWGTPDDEPWAANQFYRHPCQDVTSKQVLAYEPGADAVWGNADDTNVQSLTVYEVTSDCLELSSIGYASGVDGLLGTADDIEASRFTTDFSLYADGTGVVLRSFYTGNVQDGMERKVYNSFGQVEEWRRIQGAGVDVIWGTSDDFVVELMKWIYDKNGNAERRDVIGAPGADAIWGTNDDVVTQSTWFEVVSF